MPICWLPVHIYISVRTSCEWAFWALTKLGVRPIYGSMVLGINGESFGGLMKNGQTSGGWNLAKMTKNCQLNWKFFYRPPLFWFCLEFLFLHQLELSIQLSYFHFLFIPIPQKTETLNSYSVFQKGRGQPSNRIKNFKKLKRNVTEKRIFKTLWNLLIFSIPTALKMTKFPLWF